MSSLQELVTLSESDWQSKAIAHRKRAEKWTQPYRERRARSEMHPVHDFLFIYYRFAPTLLEHWHPGYGYALESSGHDWNPKYYHREGAEVRLDPNKIDAKIRKRLEWSRFILKAAMSRPPQFGCYGLHEWAMVYQGGPEGRPRHEGTLPLRLSQSETDQVVESQPLCCSHFDAFRFFTQSAMPLNKLQPSQENRLENEQAGCLHTNMDVYKWTAKCMPWLSTELLWDTFEYAVSCRVIDMRASPYDCSELGYTPICIETPEGRVQYETEQRLLSEKAKPLRNRIIQDLEIVLSL